MNWFVILGLFVPVLFATHDRSLLQSSACSAGSYYDSVGDVCRSCPFGTYSDSVNATACTDCPPLKHTAVEGATSVDSCMDWDVTGSNWYYFPTTGNPNPFYRTFTFKTTFSFAQNQCKLWGGRLAIPKSSKITTSLKNVSNLFYDQCELLWVGLEKNLSTSNWCFIDGSCAGDYTNWGDGEPNNLETSLSGENCGSIFNWNGKGGQWNDQGCLTQQCYLCETRFCMPGTYVSPYTGTFDCSLSSCPSGYAADSKRVCYRSCDPGQTYNGTDCVDCPVGQYSTGGLSSEATCKSCPAGFYADVTGSSSCTGCSPGRFSTSGSSVCTDCAVGTFTSVSNSTVCSNCAAGRYADVTASTACVDCAVGSYTANQGSTTCAECPGSKHTAVTGSTSCVNWEVTGNNWFYFPTAGNPNPFYKAVPAQINFTAAQAQCAAFGGRLAIPRSSKISAVLKNLSNSDEVSSECESLWIGLQRNSSDWCFLDGTCLGSYTNWNPSEPNTDLNSGDVCGSNAVGGKWIDLHCSTNDCYMCEAPSCPSGTYVSPSTGTLECSLSYCPTGYEADDSGLCESCGSQCLTCPAGQYVSEGVCVDCSAGTYSSASGASTCTSCTPGTFSGSGSSVCTSCSPGQYSSAYGASSCMDCPANTFADGYGTLYCKDCEENQVSEVGSASCRVPSAAGQRASAGELAGIGAAGFVAFLILVYVIRRFVFLRGAKSAIAQTAQKQQAVDVAPSTLPADTGETGERV